MLGLTELDDGAPAPPRPRRGGPRGGARPPRPPPAPRGGPPGQEAAPGRGATISHGIQYFTEYIYNQKKSREGEQIFKIKHNLVLNFDFKQKYFIKNRFP